MSSDSRPSFRTYSKNKIKKLMSTNLTLSIRERLISNETYNHIIDKSRNLTDTVIDQTGLGKLLNETKSRLPNIFPSHDNSTIPKGFYDSLFNPQIENDVYLKVTIICLWIIAMLFLLLTIITMFIPFPRNRVGITGVKMIFFHIFLCEWFYLIYILLSMINVGLDFQLNSLWCDIAIYGAYGTVPVTYVALFILSFERIIKHFKLKSSWTKIFTSICITQSLFIFIWAICIGTITTIIYIKRRLIRSVVNLPGKVGSKRFASLVGKIFSPDQCSIDGQLLPAFKILFVILFVILIILIIKSLILSTFYDFFIPSCWPTKNKKKKAKNDKMTLIFLIFLFLNLVFSFPFYFISTGNSIKQVILGGKPFPMILKFSFILRLSSIILQCLIFYILESDSWNLLNKLLHCLICRKCPVPRGKTSDKRKPVPSKQPREPSTTDSDDSDIPADKHKNHFATEVSATDQSDDDSVFEAASTTKTSTAKKPQIKVESTTDEDESDDEPKVIQKQKSPTSKKDINGKLSQKNDQTKDKKLLIKKPTSIHNTTDEDESDDEPKVIQKPKSPTSKKDISGKLSQKNDQTKDEKLLIKKTTSIHNTTNGVSKQISNEKSTTQRIPSAIIDRKISKPHTDQNHIEYDSILPDSLSEAIANSSTDSDDDIKPPVTKPKIHLTTHPSWDKRKRTGTVLPTNHRSHHQHHRTTRSRVSQPRTTTSDNHNHTEIAKLRKKSPRKIDNHIEQPKKDRLSKILANSHEV